MSYRDAGPTGLLLAGDLAAARCNVLALEAASGPHWRAKAMSFGVLGLLMPMI